MKGSSVIKRNIGDVDGLFLEAGTLTMLDASSIRGHQTLPSTAVVAIGRKNSLPSSFTMKGQSRVTDNRVSEGWGVVLKLVCPPEPGPTFAGVKARTTGNTPKNIVIGCP